MTDRTVLVLNSGSSTLKYRLVRPDTGESTAHGLIERIGEGMSAARLTIGGETFTRDYRVADHEAALRTAFDLFAEAGTDLASCGIVAVGHRAVHGGETFHEASPVDDALIAEMEELAPLAPLHNPPAVLGMEVARTLLPDLPHIAVFDTAFFHDLPPEAAHYAIDRGVARVWKIRRYGFHGTSHDFVSRAAAEYLGRPRADIHQIVLHLGNGASASAIAGDRPLDTSMGMTPMEGLVMGTRAGDIDPGVVFYLGRTANMSFDKVESILNKRSGLLGMANETDFRQLHEQIEAGNPDAELAYGVYLHRLRKYIGAYLAVLGRTDVITFTAGVGENDARVRRDVLTGLEGLGIVVDDARNEALDAKPRRISTDDSPITVLVVPTNEELAIAQACVAVLDG